MAGNRPAPPLGRVSYPDLWPGIMVDYDAVADGIAETTYTVAPGADVSAIQLRYNIPVTKRPDGSLQYLFASERGELTESAPVAWQEIAEARVEVPVEFIVSSNDQVSFSAPSRDPRYPLIIDPIYAWHTFYGGANSDTAMAIATDVDGNVYVTGWSNSTWNGPASQHPKNDFVGGTDLFVLKLNSSGDYQWHTFYGLGGDQGFGIAADTSGNVYVAGVGTNWNGPASQPPKHHHSTNSSDILVLKLDSTGAYQWHTFFGKDGTGLYPQANAVALDSNVNVLVTGASPEFADPTTPLHSAGSGTDTIVLKLNSDGVYQWHTFYGADTDQGSGIAADTNGDIYISSTSHAAWNGPQTTDTPRNDFAGGQDIAVLKLNSSGAYQWHTFYGSSTYDAGDAITVDVNHDVVAVGTSDHTWNGPGPLGPLHPMGDPLDVVVLKLGSNGAYKWHTFYGGTSIDELYAVTTDRDGNIYTTGYTLNSNWAGPSGQSPLHNLTGGIDILLLKLNSAGVYQWHGFYGSSQGDDGYGIALDSEGDIYVAGMSGDSWSMPGPVDPLNDYAGGNDITVLKITRLATTTGLTSSVNPSIVGQTGSFTATVTGSDAAPSGTVTFTDGSNIITGCSAKTLTDGQASCSTSSLGVGTHGITASYGGDNDYGISSSSVLTQVVNFIATTTTVQSSHSSSPFGQSVTFTATVSTDTGTPTGTVDFKDGGASIGSCSARPLSSGQTTCSTASLLVGTHNITASYSGDTTHAAGSSTPLSQVISPLTSSIVVTASRNPAALGQSITFTATVSETGGTPTGTVDFRDGSTIISGCTARPLTGGQATCITNSLSQGSHSITSVYSGDAISAGSASTPLAEIVEMRGLFLPFLRR